MKRKLLTIAAVITVAFTIMGVGPCQTTGDYGADAAAYWNSPATQALLQKIQDEAFSWITGRLNSATGNVGGGYSVASIKDQAVINAGKNHPTVPAGKIREAVDQAYVRAQQ